MQTTQPAYFFQYRSLKLTREAQSVLVVEFHSNGRSLTFTAQITRSLSTLSTGFPMTERTRS
jgi:hypothetical protein